MSANPLPAHPPETRHDETSLMVERRPEIRAAFLAHVALFVALNTSIAVINALVSPAQLWFPLVVWGWAIVLAIHGSWTYPHQRMVRWHAGFYVLVNAGLVGINISQGGPPWAIWPILSLGVVLLAHWLIATRRVSLFRMHLIATSLASGVLLLTPLFIDTGDLVPVLAPTVELWGLVLVHWLLRSRRWPPFRIHLMVYAVVMTGLAAANAIEGTDEWWVVYPLVIWGLLVVGHGAATLFRLPTTGLTIEETFIAHARDRSSPMWPVWMLAIHGIFLSVVALAMGIMDLIDGTDRLWAMWPVGAWLTLLAVHAGFVLMPTKLFGAHLFAWIAGSIGMLAIDAGTDGGPWWFFPVMWWGVIVAIHAGFTLPRGVRLLGVHTLGGAALTIAFVITNELTGDTIWWWYPVGAIVLTISVHLGLLFTQRMYSTVDRQRA